MSFSPWAILAIVLTAISVAGLYGLHLWRSRIDMRAAQAAKEQQEANNDKALPPSDLGESGEGPGPGPGFTPSGSNMAPQQPYQQPYQQQQQYQQQQYQQQYYPPPQQQQMSQQEMRQPALPPVSASSSGERTFVEEGRPQQRVA